MGATDLALLTHGLVAAAGAALLAVAFTLVRRASSAPHPADRRPSPIGLLAVGSALIGLASTVGRPPATLVLGLVLLVLATWLLAPTKGGGRARAAGLAILALPGAGLVVGASDVRGGGMVVLVAAVAALCPIVARFDACDAGRDLGPPFVALSCLGVYLAVPDTEHALVLLGASLPWSLLGWPSHLLRLGSGGAVAVLGMVAWVAAEGGVTAPSGIVASLTALGLLVAEPLARPLRRRGWPRRAARRPSAASAARALTAQGVIVLAAARLVPWQPRVALALATASLVLAAAVLFATSEPDVESGDVTPGPPVPQPHRRRP